MKRKRGGVQVQLVQIQRAITEQTNVLHRLEDRSYSRFSLPFGVRAFVFRTIYVGAVALAVVAAVQMAELFK